MEEISKSLKILMLLNELGISGTANLLSNYQRRYKNDLMSRKLIANVLNVYGNWGYIRKKYGKRNKQFWGYNPQTYEVTENGEKYLKNKEQKRNHPLIIP